MIQILEKINAVKHYLDDLKKRGVIDAYKVYNRLFSSLDVYVILLDDSINFIEKFNERINPDGRYKINLIVYSKEERNNDEYVADIFEGFEGHEIEYGARFRLNPYFEYKSIRRENGENSIPVVTFYSYKGGMGRTTTMISYAINLAMQDKRVFILDCDLEAPGYLNFFNLSKQVDLNNGRINGFVEYVSDTQFYKDPDVIDIGNYIIDVGQFLTTEHSDKLHNIYIMPAGNLNENESDGNRSYHRIGYLEGLSRINLTNSAVVKKTFRQLFEKVESDIQPDIILIDSRTGFNDIIGNAITYFSDTIVGFFGSNRQTLPGLLQLLDSYKTLNFKLVLVNSILPKGDSGIQSHESFKDLVNGYFSDITDEDKDFPDIFPLFRTGDLEYLGVSSFSDDKYVDYVKNNKNEDYKNIFSSNTLPFNSSKIVSEHISKNGDTYQNYKTITLRNKILQNLKKTFSHITAFAESADISESTFFYRYCMYDLFDENKFLILGYKGTGKTYLYKALADSNKKEESKKIANEIVKRANILRRSRHQVEVTPNLHFIDVISINPGDNRFIDFNNIDIDAKNRRDFTFFWQIYTWNSIMLDDKFKTLRQDSSLKEYILPINGDEASLRFEYLTKKGLIVLTAIKDDLMRVNKYLEKNNEKLFILYDQLDTRIPPMHWNKVVSPLINYWRDYWNTYNNILPKIFIRTDMFNYKIEGTNTARLVDNIINIEWSIEEIFAYLIKLIFSNRESKDMYFEIMNRVYKYSRGRGEKWKQQRRLFDENDNQLPINAKIAKIDGAEIYGYTNVFFGEKVISIKGKDLGRPSTYFKNNLSNADRKSISLRPFINTLDKNAIELALKKVIPNGYVQELISSDIYASREVRINAANSYFEDLAKDDYKDLRRFYNYMISDNGKQYRCKSLTEKSFNTLIDEILKFYHGDFETIKSTDDFKNMLYATGIVAEKPTTGGKLYQFAPIYYYAWGLKNSKYDNEKNEDFD